MAHQRLAQHIRTAAAVNEDIETQLTAMASDPKIQDELQMEKVGL